MPTRAGPTQLKYRCRRNHGTGRPAARVARPTSRAPAATQATVAGQRRSSLAASRRTARAFLCAELGIGRSAIGHVLTGRSYPDAGIPVAVGGMLNVNQAFHRTAMRITIRC
jgi:hypothetical protein